MFYLEKLLEQMQFTKIQEKIDFLNAVNKEILSHQKYDLFIQNVKHFGLDLGRAELYKLTENLEKMSPQSQQEVLGYFNSLSNCQLSTFYKDCEKTVIYNILEQRMDQNHSKFDIINVLEQEYLKFQNYSPEEFKTIVDNILTSEAWITLTNDKTHKDYNIAENGFLKKRLKDIKKLRTQIYANNENIFLYGNLSQPQGKILPVLLSQNAENLVNLLLFSKKEHLEVFYKQLTDKDKEKILLHFANNICTDLKNHTRSYLKLTNFKSFSTSLKHSIVVNVLYLAKECPDKFNFLFDDLSIYDINMDLTSLLSQNSGSKKIQQQKQELLTLIEKQELKKSINPNSNESKNLLKI